MSDEKFHEYKGELLDSLELVEEFYCMKKPGGGYYETRIAPDEYFFIQIAGPNDGLDRAIIRFHDSKELTHNLEGNLEEIKGIAEARIVQDELLHKVLAALGEIDKAKKEKKREI
jgi:hypothetical protein